MERLFVYGTLGPGRPNEHVMQKIGGSWQPASVRGRLVQAGWGFERSGFPALVLDEDGEEITGHVFVSPNLAAHWPALDAFEGEDYVRELTRAILADGTEVEACVYALAGRGEAAPVVGALTRRAEPNDVTPPLWIEATGAIGIRSKADRAGSTSTYKDIACELGSRGSLAFKCCHTSRTIAR